MKYKVTLKYVFPVEVEAKDEQEARTKAWNKGAEALILGNVNLEVPIVEKVEEI